MPIQSIDARERDIRFAPAPRLLRRIVNHMEKLNEKDLKNEIADMRERFPRFQDSDLFVAWFLKAYVTEKEPEAIAALVGGARDKSLDAVHIDDASKTVVIVQGKYR